MGFIRIRRICFAFFRRGYVIRLFGVVFVDPVVRLRLNRHLHLGVERHIMLVTCSWSRHYRSDTCVHFNLLSLFIVYIHSGKFLQTELRHCGVTWPCWHRYIITSLHHYIITSHLSIYLRALRLNLPHVPTSRYMTILYCLQGLHIQNWFLSFCVLQVNK